MAVMAMKSSGGFGLGPGLRWCLRFLAATASPMRIWSVRPECEPPAKSEYAAVRWLATVIR